MACYKPLRAYRGGSDKKILFKRPDHWVGPPNLNLPCGQCIGCRLKHSENWAIRCMHEASMHDQNAFITLTYSPEHLPRDFSLNKVHFQDFMKRLRYHFDGDTLRFFHCGEYGDNLERPHYHACLFGIDFEDRTLLKQTEAGSKIYTSAMLEHIWGMGFCTVGDVTFESAAYVARYVTKKITGDRAIDHYIKTDPRTGEAFDVSPEYVTMSRRPGIAREWWLRYREEVTNGDSVLINGREIKPPRYYDKLFEAHHGDVESLKKLRVENAKRYAANNTPARLRVREICQNARFNLLKRGLEDGPE